MTLASPAIPAPSLRPRLARSAATLCGALLLGTGAGFIILAVVATRFFGYQVLTVSSDSMAPALATGDLILVKPAAIRNVRAGDIVLFESGGDRVPTVHRVAGVNEIETRFTDRASGAVETSTEYRLVTKGDNSPAPDPRDVTASQLRGEVWFSIPHAGALGNSALSVVLVLVLVTAVATWATWEVALRLRRRRGATS